MNTSDLPTRRTALRAAAVGSVGLGTAAGAAAASAAPTGHGHPHHGQGNGGHGHGGRPGHDHGHHGAPGTDLPGGRGIEPGAYAFVAVTTATAWVEPGLARDIDAPALANPVDLDEWNAAMAETEPRRWLTGKLETQAVLGSPVIVDEVDGEWAHVVVTTQPSPRDSRGYPGWIPVRQLVVDDRFADLAESARTATVTAKRSRLSRTPSGRHAGIEVSFDTILPVLHRSGHAVEVALPGGDSGFLPADDVVVREHGEQPPRPTVEDIIATGERFLGLRYLWAGVSAFGYDCSGYTYTLFHHHGITLNRDAGPQKTDSGLEPVDRKDLRRGDLVFFSTEPGAESIRHVALYVGDDMIMQAPNAERSVEVVSLTEYDTDGEYAGARRVLQV